MAPERTDHYRVVNAARQCIVTDLRMPFDLLTINAADPDTMAGWLDLAGSLPAAPAVYVEDFMEPGFTVSGRINKPAHKVYEAVADPTVLSRYFTTGGAKGRMESGATVTWEFHDFPGRFPVHVVNTEQDQSIEFRWGATGGAAKEGETETTVVFTFTSLDDGRTLIEISESGFRDSEAGWQAALDQCGGWTAMLCAMRVWLEHEINLREGFYI